VSNRPTNRSHLDKRKHVLEICPDFLAKSLPQKAPSPVESCLHRLWENTSGRGRFARSAQMPLVRSPNFVMRALTSAALVMQFAESKCLDPYAQAS
jgi:hypothetical protein